MTADGVPHTRRGWIEAAAVCLLAAVVYWLSLAPTITWQHDGADSGDLATAVAVGGVPHPSGYPTYLALAELFQALPLGGDVAYRLNLMSAICAAVAAGLLSLAIGQSLRYEPGESNRPPADLLEASAVLAALIFAFSTPFWSQAVIAEVYALNALCVAWLVWLALRVRAGREGELAGLCVATGLALGNHLSMLFVLPLVAALVWPAYWRQGCGRRVALVLLIAAGLSVYGLLPWRAAAHPPVNWGGADQWAGLSWLVNGEAYQGYVFGLPWSYVGSRMLALTQITVRALAWWGVPVALWGWQVMLRRDRALAIGSLLTVTLIAVYAVGYNTRDSYVYLLPALMLMSVWLAWGTLDLLRLAGPSLQRAGLAWALLILPLASAALNFPAMSLRDDRTALDFAERALSQAAPNALILVDDDRHTFALWYARYALGQRPDVTIVNVSLLSYDWYRASLAKAHPGLPLSPDAGDLIRQAIGDGRPVYGVGDTLTLPDQLTLEASQDADRLRRVSAASGP
jgi:hypothetical protein